MLELLFKAGHARKLEGIEVLPQVDAEFSRDFGRLRRVDRAEHLDGGEGVVQEMRLNLGHHDLDALLGHQVPLVLAHQLQMQPDVIKHAADRDGHGQEADGLLLVMDSPVHENGRDDHRRNEDGDSFLLPSALAGIPDRLPDERSEQDRADIQRHPRQGAAVIMVVGSDREAEAGKQRRYVDERVEADKEPPQPVLPLRADKVQEQDQKDRTHAVAEDGSQRAQPGPRRAEGELVLHKVLHDQAEAQRRDDEHDPALLRADIGVDQHGEDERGQQQKQREERRKRTVIQCHAPVPCLSLRFLFFSVYHIRIRRGFQELTRAGNGKRRMCAPPGAPVRLKLSTKCRQLEAQKRELPKRVPIFVKIKRERE